jgi:hypothetical protein
VLEPFAEGPGPAQVRVPERGVAENLAALIAGLGTAQICDQPVLDPRFRVLALEQAQEQRRLGDPAGAPVLYRPLRADPGGQEIDEPGMAIAEDRRVNPCQYRGHREAPHGNDQATPGNVGTRR